MRKLLVAVAGLLLALGVAWAQQPSSSDSNATEPGDADSEVTVQGCLGGTTGNFTLLGSDGMTYRLQGNNDELKKHVGHMVAVTGILGTDNSTTTGTTETSPSDTSAAGTTGAERTLSVTNLQHMSSSCSQTSTTGSPK